MPAPAVPEGQAPPFAVVTPTDHSAWIIIATAFGLSCVLLFSFIRLFIRLTIAPPFGLDDAFLGSATVCFPCIRYISQRCLATYHHLQVISIVQSSITLYAASLGLGKSIELVNPEGLAKVQKVSLHHGPSSDHKSDRC